jgi:probable HAF family extracellular repeat protein
MKAKIFVVIVLGLLSVSVTRSANAMAYEVTELNPVLFLNGGSYEPAALPQGINNAGQVVGTTPIGYPVIWNGVVPTSLGGQGYAYAINNAGQVVGVQGYTATRWSGSITTPPLSPLPEAVYSIARGINDNGQVAGTSQGYTANGTLYGNAVIWNGGTPTALSTPSGSGSSAAYAINNSGQVVGVINGFGATIWNSGVPTALPGGSVAIAINNAGQVLGYGNNGPSVMLWSGGTATNLGMFSATGINNAGQVVGYSVTDNGSVLNAVLWENGTLLDLNNLLDSSGAGWTLWEATAINDLGQIVGAGFVDGGSPTNGELSAFLLTPCDTCVAVPYSGINFGVSGTPLPATLPLFATGLGALGLFGWRRKRKNAAIAAA